MSDVFIPSKAHLGNAFEDTVDGYFPLRESLRQMMLRHEFDVALIHFQHAPAMEIPGLDFEEPVPLSITSGHACMIHKMLLVLHRTNNGVTISGVGQWTWWGDHRATERVFSSEHRLAEPAFVRGIYWKDERTQYNGYDETKDHRQYFPNLEPNQILTGDYGLKNSQLLVTAATSSATFDLGISLNSTRSNDTAEQRIMYNFLAEIGKIL